MREAEARHALNDMLDRLGIVAGSIVMVHSDMTGVPLPRFDTPVSRDAMRALRIRLCAFLCDVLMERLGSGGTLVVPTFTYSTTRPGGLFELEKTPSEVGPFSEFVRLQPKARRSFHPIFSLAALGARSEEIIEGCGPAAFGRSSPWDRLSAQNARILTLGIPFNEPTTYVHHVEQCFGVPHRFHKTLEVPMYRGGRRIEGVWLAYLRYRSVDIGPDLKPLEQALRSRGFLAETEWNGRRSSAVDTRDVDAVGYAMLDEDPWAFATRRVVMRINEDVPASGPSVEAIADFDLRPSETGASTR